MPAVDDRAPGEAFLELGRREAGLGRYTEAETAFRDAVRVAGAHGEAVRAAAGAELALLAQRGGMRDEALALAEAAVDQAAHVGPPSALAAVALAHAALVVAGSGDTARAARLVDLAAATTPGDGSVEAALAGYAVAGARGSLARLEGRYEEAIADLLAARASADALPAPRPVDRAATDVELAVCARALGRLDEAERYTRDALARLAPVGGDAHPDGAVILDHLASLGLAVAETDSPGGIALLREAVARLETAGDEGRPQLALHWNNLGGTLAAAGDLDGAADAYGRALALKDAHGAPPASLVVTLVNLAGIQRRRRHLVEAEAAYRRVLALVDEQPDTDPRIRRAIADGLRAVDRARGPLITLAPRPAPGDRPN